MSPKARPGDVRRELARRLRAAADESWDADRCEVEASSFLAELRQRGWSLNHDVDWRQPAPEPQPMSDQAFTALAAARRALRAARTTPSKPTTTAGGTS